MSEEILPLVDNDGNVTGKAPRSMCHSNPDLLHPVVHLHVLNCNGEIYLQKRALTKRIQPGKWDTAVGGHISYGEEVIDALRREAHEEIGLNQFEPVFITKYKFTSAVETEFVHVFATITDQSLTRQNDEIDDARYWTFSQIYEAIGKGVLTPNFEKEFIQTVDTPLFRERLKKLAPAS